MVGNSSLEVNATNDKERRSRRVLVGVLSGLGVLIVGLVVVVIVTTYLGNISNNALEVYETEISQRISDLGPGDIEEGIAIYQEYIDKVGLDDQARLYTMRSVWITSMDIQDKYGRQVLDDVVVADSILQTINSAVNVVNSAYNYGDEDLADEYNDILLKRQAADGIDIDELMRAEG